MNELTVDTVKMEEIGKDIQAKTAELVAIYQNAMDLLALVRENNYWSGISANAFFAKVSKDNRDYIKFFNSLNKYGNSFINISQKYENIINRYKVNK